MSDCDSSCTSQKKSITNNQLCEGCECSEDEGRRLKRREKNRVAAQKSRKRQTQRADLLHEVKYHCIDKEQHLLTEVLRAHEPLCPIMHCSCTSSSLQPDDMLRLSVLLFLPLPRWAE
uniref:BZIP domain-containing protein n=1 Tax=Amphiprion percula TaxID=161767 RepID=A0A3P8T6W5_AMPPE